MSLKNLRFMVTMASKSSRVAATLGIGTYVNPGMYCAVLVQSGRKNN
jgi:hypothetical protein